jgi:hypothetical protein
MSPAFLRAYTDLKFQASPGWPEHIGRRAGRDVVDTLRALRCVDALCQRGTVQKTSGGYQVFSAARPAAPLCLAPG